MAKVPMPYTTQIQVPGDVNIPRISVDTPGEAFGTSIGSAMKGLSATLEKVGDEVFARGMAMQQLNNESEAKAADTEYLIESGRLHAEYNSLQGKAAVDAYPKYKEDLESARYLIGDKIKSPEARRMYERDTLGVMGRHIFNGAGRAATENKRFAVGVSEAKVKAIGDRALTASDNDHAFLVSVNDVRNETIEQGQLMGLGDEQIEQNIAEKVSDLWSKRITGMARTEPIKANKLLSKAMSEGRIRGEDIAKTQNAVRQQLYTTGSRQISNGLRSGLTPGSVPVDITSAKAAIGGFESGNNYAAQGPEVIGKDGKSRGRALGKYQVMPENLPGWLKEAGLMPMTPEEFLKNPKAQDAVFETIFGGYMKKYGSFNEAASMWFSGKPMAQAGDRKDNLGTTVPLYLKQTNAILSRNMPLQTMIDRGKGEAETLAPNDPLFGDYVQQRITADYNLQLAAKRNDIFINRQVVETGLVGADRPPTTLDELFAENPNIEASWNQLDASVQRNYLGVLAKNAKGDVNWTSERLGRYSELKGMASTDPAAFMDVQITMEDLPWATKKALLEQQTKLKGSAQADPRVVKALQILSPDLNAAGVSRATNPQTYFQFVGALQDALSDFTGENKRAPKADEVQKIGARLLQEQSESGKWFGIIDGKTQMFQVPVPTADAELIRNEPAWQDIGITPTPEQIQRVYTRRLYQKLYGGAPKTDTPKPPMAR